MQTVRIRLTEHTNLLRSRKGHHGNARGRHRMNRHPRFPPSAAPRAPARCRRTCWCSRHPAAGASHPLLHVIRGCVSSKVHVDDAMPSGAAVENRSSGLTGAIDCSWDDHVDIPLDVFLDRELFARLGRRTHRGREHPAPKLRTAGDSTRSCTPSRKSRVDSSGPA